MAAPRGSKALFKKVEAYIRNNADKAARYLGISEAYAKRVQRHVAARKPLGKIIKTKKGLEKWQDRLKTARQLTRAEKVARKVKEAGLKSTDLAEASGRDPKEVHTALNRMVKGKPVEPALVKDISKARQTVKAQGPYQESVKVGKQTVKVWVYPSEDSLKADVPSQYPQALWMNKASPFLQDVLNFVANISNEYFIVVREAEEEVYRVYDVRSPEERRKR
jgi:hypothetical protein